MIITENKTPIIKTSIAALSLMISRYKEILFISIVPIIFMLPAMFILPEIFSQIKTSKLTEIVLPTEAFIYGIMFIYGYASLNINLYRMVVLGFNGIYKFGIIPFKTSITFIALSMLVSLLNFAPIMLQVPILEPIVFIFVSHLMLNLVIIAIDSKVQRWKLPFTYRLNIALLQFVIPLLFLSLFSLLGVVATIVAKILLVYWTAINLGLVFNQLFKSDYNP
jgi:hypothetical protein